MDLSNGPDWQVVALFSISILIALIGFYARTLATRVNKVEESLNNLHILLYKEYHTKQEVSFLLSDLKVGIESLHRRFDYAGIPVSEALKK